MDNLFFPTETDFRRWIREGIREYFEAPGTIISLSKSESEFETLLSRKEIAGIFRISLVTLHDWMKKGLPSHKQGGRVYFLRSEVMDYVKMNHALNLKIPAGEKVISLNNSDAL